MTTTAVAPVLTGTCTCTQRVSAVWGSLQGDADRRLQMQRRVQCPRCTRTVPVAFVDGRVGKRECGDHCTEGVGRKCTCTCGGASHGLAWRVR